MGTTHVALIRDINVGRASRVAMADLRDLFARLGYTDVRTVLNSGNVVFRAPMHGEDAGGVPSMLAARIAAAMEADLGVSARVIVLESAQIANSIEDNPLGGVATDPSRLLFGFAACPSDVDRLRPLLDQDWEPEVLALGRQVAYLWCPNGMVASRLAQAVGRILGDDVTFRNAATVAKVYAAVQETDG